MTRTTILEFVYSFKKTEERKGADGRKGVAGIYFAISGKWCLLDFVTNFPETIIDCTKEISHEDLKGGPHTAYAIFC